MKTIRLSTIGASVLASILIAGSAYAENQGNKDKQANKPATKIDANARFQVIDADTLIGSNVYTTDGRDVGEIEYLLIRTSDGTVRYAVVDAEGAVEESLERQANDGDADMIAIPWHALGKNFDRDEMKLTITYGQALAAPRVTEDGLNQLLEPAMITRVSEYWQPYTAKQAGGDGRMKSNEQKNTEKSKADIDVLVARSVITTLVPATLAKAGELDDVEVTSSDGKDAGEIERIAIDTKRGRVAYLLLSRGGFLGLGEEIVPVPFEVVQFRDNDEARLTVSSAKLKKMQRFPMEDLPRDVRAADLKRLYERFGAQAYWMAEETEERDERASR